MTACVICTTGQQAHVGYLCGGHHERMGAMLRDIEDQAALLDARPSMQQRSGSGRGSLASERSAARDDVIAYLDPRTRRWEPDDGSRYIPPAPKAYGPWCLFCDHQTCTDWRAGRRRDLHDDEYDAGSSSLASILDELHNWARAVREDRDLTPPETVTVSGERDLLTRHLDWIAEQPWVDECFGDLHTLLGHLQTANRTKPARPVGHCYLPGDSDDGTCNGNIWRQEQDSSPWLPLEDRCVRVAVKSLDGPARCDKCGATWDGPQLAMLNFELEKAKRELARPRTEDGRKMLTATELAAKLRTTENGVRIRLSRAGAKAVSGHYDPKVLDAPSDVAS